MSGNGEDGNVRNSADGPFERLLRATGRLVAAVVLLVLATLDVAVNAVQLPVVLLAIAVAVVMPRLKAATLGTGALLLGAFLVLVALTVPTVDYGIVPFGFTVAVVGLVLIGLAAWRAEAVRAGFAVPLLLAGLVLQPTRLGNAKAAVVLALVIALGGVIAGAAGLSLRMFQTNRHRQMIAAQQAQRTGIASDLHDYVAHHVTGMVVLAQAAQTVAASSRRPSFPPCNASRRPGTRP
jgi:signal transduction histidine kinase